MPWEIGIITNLLTILFWVSKIQYVSGWVVLFFSRCHRGEKRKPATTKTPQRENYHTPHYTRAIWVVLQRGIICSHPVRELLSQTSSQNHPYRVRYVWIWTEITLKENDQKETKAGESPLLLSHKDAMHASRIEKYMNRRKWFMILSNLCMRNVIKCYP